MTGPSPRLLLVDDEEANRDMLSRRLARQGYEVVTAPGGREALAELDRAAYDLVLLDIQMPEMSGLDTLKALRLRFPVHKLPVIMVTAKVQSEDIVEALGLGANDYVTKPVDLAVTVARIKTQLARCAAEQALIESEERYALAVRGANDGLWDWKAGDSAMYLSPRWKEILGYADEELANDRSSWLSRVHPDDAARLEADLDDHLSGRTQQFENEHRVRHQSGTYRWVLVRGVAVRGADGRAVRVAGSLTDITEGKVADALTGLPNRVLFVDWLGRLLEQSKRRTRLVLRRAVPRPRPVQERQRQPRPPRGRRVADPVGPPAADLPAGDRHDQPPRAPGGSRSRTHRGAARGRRVRHHPQRPARGGRRGRSSPSASSGSSASRSASAAWTSRCRRAWASR